MLRTLGGFAFIVIVIPTLLMIGLNALSTAGSDLGVTEFFNEFLKGWGLINDFSVSDVDSYLDNLGK